MSKHKFIFAFAAAGAMAAGFWFSSMQQPGEEMPAEEQQQQALAEARSDYSPIQGTILSPARKITVPALVKDNGETFTLEDLSGHWSLLFFGYTHCPDICPVTMGVVAKAKKTATANNHMFPQVVFVSVDPERDRLEMLSDYVRYFDKDFVGITGAPSMIKALTLQMSVVYMKVPAASSAGKASNADIEGSNYTVDHSAALLLLNPEGKLVAFFNPPHDPETILKDFQTIVNLSNQDGGESSY